MAKVIAALALALAVAQEPAKQDKAGQDLDAALVKAAQMNNYTAGIQVRKEGAAEPGKADGLAPIEVRLMPGAALHMKCGEFEGYRQGDVFIVKEGGAWKKYEPTGETGPNSQERMAKVRAPHEILRDLKSSSFKQVRREDTEGSRVFSGELTDVALRRLMAGKKDADADAATGNAMIWVGSDGVVTKCELVIDKKADAKAVKMTKTIEFREIGSTKYEIPADAQKALGGKPMDEPKK